MMMCVWAPPSDQDWKVYFCGPLFWLIGALMLLCDPTITVRVKVVANVDEPTASCKPFGTVWNVSTTLCGSRRRVFVAVNPLESVAVRLICRYEGYSWSGATNDPDATPSK